MFDPRSVPSDVASPELLAELNKLLQDMSEKKKDHICFQENSTGFRVSNMVRSYCQVQLWRVLDILESAEELRRAGRGLGAMMLVRAVYETVASFLHFEKAIVRKIGEASTSEDLQKIHDFVHGKTLATRLEHLKDVAGEDLSVQATSILTQIDSMVSSYEEARKDFDHLCEYAHPNSFGGHLWYGDHDPNSDIIRFSSADPEKYTTLRWVIQAASLLAYMKIAFERIEESLPVLSELASKTKK